LLGDGDLFSLFTPLQAALSFKATGSPNLEWGSWLRNSKIDATMKIN